MHKKIIFLFLFLGIFGLAKSSWAACSGSGLSWNCTAGTTVAQVKTAVSSASSGATINFAAGLYSWLKKVRVH